MTISPQPLPPELIRRIPPPEEELEVEELEAKEPEREESGDNMSDLFEGPAKDDLSDLTDVSEEDVMGENSDLSDLVDVTNEDVMGEEPKPRNSYRITRAGRRNISRYPPPTSLGGLNL